MKKVNHLLIAIMFNEPLPQGFSYFNLTAKFKEQFDSEFGRVDPITMIPPNQLAPPEVPRYILQTNDFSFSFSGIRFELHFNNISDFTLSDLEDYIGRIRKVFEYISINVFRIGIVLDGVIDTEGNPIDFLKDYINIENLKDSFEYHIYYRDMMSKDGYNYNKWVRYIALKDNYKINFQLDLNTVDFISSSQLLNVYEKHLSEGISEFIGS